MKLLQTGNSNLLQTIEQSIELRDSHWEFPSCRLEGIEAHRSLFEEMPVLPLRISRMASLTVPIDGFSYQTRSRRVKSH
jgi:hypothetical protein